MDHSCGLPWGVSLDDSRELYHGKTGHLLRLLHPAAGAGRLPHGHSGAAYARFLFRSDGPTQPDHRPALRHLPADAAPLGVERPGAFGGDHLPHQPDHRCH